jgi:hypothetical protein
MDEILVNTTTGGIQREPAVTGFLGSKFMVVWSDTSDTNIKCQLFSATGDKISGEVIVNTPTPTATNTRRQRPAIASHGGGLAVVWIEDAANPPGPLPHVKAQRFNRDGIKVGREIQVSTADVDPTQPPSVAGLIDGGFVVTWADARFDQRIRAQRFKIEGEPNGLDFRVNTADGFHDRPIVSQLVGGNFVIAWRDDPHPPGGGRLVFRIFDVEATPVGEEIAPNLPNRSRGSTVMTFLDNQRFVIAYVRSEGQSDLDVQKSFVEARVFEPDGKLSTISVSAPHGEDLKGEPTIDGDIAINSSSPAVAPLVGGRFVLAWAQKRADTFSTDQVVRAKVFSDRGDSVGEAVQVNTTRPGDRFAVCVATNFEGGDGESVFVGWGDNSKTGGDTSDLAVRGRPLQIFPSGGLTPPSTPPLVTVPNFRGQFFGAEILEEARRLQLEIVEVPIPVPAPVPVGLVTNQQPEPGTQVLPGVPPGNLVFLSVFVRI